MDMETAADNIHQGARAMRDQERKAS
jgi:hypothetical protein